MIFSKTDELFAKASRDELVRQTVMRNLKKTRTALFTIFCVISVILFGVILFLILQGPPAVLPDRSTLIDALILAAVSAMVAVGSLSAAMDADHRIKMLILMDDSE